MTVRGATSADLPAIAAIQEAAPEAARWNPEEYLQHLCLVADKNGEVVGFVAARWTAPGEAEILNLAVAPAHRRRRVARKMLETLYAGRQATWFLEVRESNRAAIALYTAEGFTPCGRRENYYRQPAEAAIVMRFVS
jgi:ribosomal-protein-alanine N-acetyltransferase